MICLDKSAGISITIICLKLYLKEQKKNCSIHGCIHQMTQKFMNYL